MGGVPVVNTGALFSPDRQHRYLLWRGWDTSLGICAFVGLNPSTADETEDDPTIRRCVNYAKAWGYGSLWMLNAYAFRATDPKDMKAQGANAVGPLNDEYLRAAARHAGVVVAAWGVHCDQVRELAVAKLVGDLHVLALSKDGRPRHPLYLRAELKPWLWRTTYEGHPVVAVAP